MTRRAAAAALSLALLAGLGGCSLTLEFDDTCSSDADCATIGPGLKCDGGFCEAKVLLEPGEPCDRIYGADPAAPDTVMFGVMLPRSGALGDLGVKMDNSVALAVLEINQIGGLLGRKLAALSCDTGTNVEQGERAARHLVEVGKVQAIVGAGASSVTIEAFSRVTRAAGVLMLSPSATSPAITTFPDDDLLWRTAPSDAIQGRAMAGLLLSEGYDRVAVINRDDAYGAGLAGAIREVYCDSADCATSLISRSYNPDSPTLDADMQAILNELAASPTALDVVILIAFVSDGAQFLNLSSGSGLRFILPDGSRSLALLGQTDTPSPVTDVELLRCIVGTNPADPEGDRAELFEQSYDARFGGTPGTFSANAYDAAYVIGLAHAAAIGADAFPVDGVPTGKALAAGLTRLSQGQPVQLGTQSGWSQGVSTLAAAPETTVDITGVSGALDFDAATGEAVSAIALWRFDVDSGAIVNLGVVLDDMGVYKGNLLVPSSSGGTCLGKRF